MKRTLLICLLGVILGGYALPKLLVWHWHRCGVLPAAANESSTKRN